MANNPLYPGYSPRKKDDYNNPMYPGYYPGQPIPKKPQSKDFLKPIEFNADVIMKQIDNAARIAMLDPTMGPKWFIERVADDWKQQLKVAVIPKNLKYTELDDYSLEEFPQASTALSLDPRDWGVSKEGLDTKKTKKQAVSTVSSWVKQATGIDIQDIRKSDFSKFENEVNRRITMHALGFSDESGQLTSMEEKAKFYFTKRVLFGKEDEEVGSQPLNVYGIKTDKDNNLYQKMAGAASDFMRDKDNAKLRDGEHSDFSRESLVAINKEVQDRYKKAIETTESNPAKEFMERHTDAVDLLNTRVSTIEEVYNLQKNLSSASSTIKKKLVSKSNKEDVSKKLKELFDNDDFYGDGELKRRGIKGSIEKLSKASESSIEKARKLFEAGELSKSDFLDLESNIKELQDHLGKINTTIKDAVDGNISLEKAIKIMDGKSMGTNLAVRNTFNESIMGKLMRGAEFSVISNEKGHLRNFIEGAETVGIDLGAKKVIPLVTRLREERDSYRVEEILGSIENGKFAERYIYKKINEVLPERITRWTTGQVLGDYLKRNNYFGLVIDDEKTLERIKDPIKLARFEEKWARKIEMKVDSTIFGVDKITIRGGDHFKIFNNEAITNSFKKTNAEKIFDFDQSDDRILISKLLHHSVGEDLELDIKDGVAQKLFNKKWSELSEKQSLVADRVIKETEELGKWMGGTLGEKGNLPQIKSLELTADPSLLGVAKISIPTGNHLSIFLDKKLDIFDLNNFKHQDIIMKLLSGDKTINLKFLQKELNLGSLSPQEAEEWQKFIEDFKKFGEWLRGQEGRFGSLLKDKGSLFKLFSAFKEGKIREKLTDPINIGDLKFQFFKKLWETNNELDPRYKLTKKFMGKLEKVNEKVSEYMKKFMSSKAGKAIKYASSWRKMLAQKGSIAFRKALSSILSKIFGAAAVATGGFLAPLLPIIERIMSMTLNKVLSYGQAFLKGLTKWDFRDIEKMLQKDMERGLRACSIVLLIPLLIFTVPSIIFFTIFSSTTSPVDSTRTESFAELVGNPIYDLPIGVCSLGQGEEGLGDLGWYYSQCNGAWANNFIGPSNVTIGQAGCLLTSLAMIYNSFGYNEITPAVIAAVLSGFQTDAGMKPPSIDYWDEKLGLNTDILFETIPGLSSDIKSQTTFNVLKKWFEDHKGGKIIIGLEKPQHWVVLAGLNSDGTDFVLYDPWLGPDLNFIEIYGDIRTIIRAVGYWTEQN